MTRVSDLIRARRSERSPFLVGVTGAVAAGKSAFAGQLRGEIAAWDDAPTVEIVTTDGFLFDNRTLEGRGLLNRKGFPETYDMAALRAGLTAIRQGPTTFPGYSHVIYDVDPALSRMLGAPGVLIVEGLGLHEGAAALGLDALVYLDAEEALLEAWFAERFMGLWRAAESDPTSFYARFRHMSEAEAHAFAGVVWGRINLPNLREHIIRGRDVADIVVTKGAGHEILGVTSR